MIIRVMYPDYRYDYVDAQALDRLIASEGITKFLRPSQQEWVYVDRDPVRGAGGEYSGPERRQAR